MINLVVFLALVAAGAVMVLLVVLATARSGHNEVEWLPGEDLLPPRLTYEDMKQCQREAREELGLIDTSPPSGWVDIAHPTSDGITTARVTEEAYLLTWRRNGWKRVRG